MKVGIRLAASDLDRPQPIRLDREWVKAEDGSRAIIRPNDLSVDEAIQWFGAASIAAATSVLFDGGWPSEQDSIPAVMADALPLSEWVGHDTVPWFAGDATLVQLDDWMVAYKRRIR